MRKYKDEYPKEFQYFSQKSLEDCLLESLKEIMQAYLEESLEYLETSLFEFPIAFLEKFVKESSEGSEGNTWMNAWRNHWKGFLTLCYPFCIIFYLLKFNVFFSVCDFAHFRFSFHIFIFFYIFYIFDFLRQKCFDIL